MSRDGLSDDMVRLILEGTRSIAVIGASAKPDRPSNGVTRALIAHGYDVYPVNPGIAGSEMFGRTVYASLKDVPGPIDMVDVFRAADAMPEVVAAVVADQQRLDIRCLWMQLGVVNLGAAATAANAGLVVVMDRCTKIELARLGVASSQGAR